MKKVFLRSLFVLFGLLWISTQVSAQGFLKKIQNVTEKVSQIAGTSTTTEQQPTAAADTVQSIKWDSIPKYTVMKYIETDPTTGEQLKNEDGTVKYRMFLVDQFGNKRSAESVAAQQAKVKQAVTSIVTKVVGGGAVGALSGLLQGGGKSAAVGGAVGAGAGIIASVDDIKQAKTWKQVLKQQEKLLEAYQKNYNEEGEPKDASVDPSTIKDLDFNEENTMSGTTEDIKKEVESASFNTTDDSAFDF